jgi:mevalonate kinase
MSIGTAPGKVILLGEHAVVYGTPAMAVPVSSVRARAEVVELPPHEPSVIHALDLGRVIVADRVSGEETSDGLLVAYHNALELVGRSPEDAHLSLRVMSRIPVARGMGSGAAVAAAIIRAVAAHYQIEVAADRLSALVYESERIYHGSPSGIDNAVVSYEAPIYFQRGAEPEVLTNRVPLVLLVADTGLASSTREVVADVRQAYEQEPARYQALFDRIGDCVRVGRAALEQGTPDGLGEAMRANHGYLQEMVVSHPALDALVEAAMSAGALGAKLSGSGRGGCMVALVAAEDRETVRRALVAAGAMHVMGTVIR